MSVCCMLFVVPSWKKKVFGGLVTIGERVYCKLEVKFGFKKIPSSFLVCAYQQTVANGANAIRGNFPTKI